MEQMNKPLLSISVSEVDEISSQQIEVKVVSSLFHLRIINSFIVK